MHLLLFSNFKKHYGRKLILEIDDLQMEDGIHVVVGPNGSGKSTLLKVLGGLIPFEGNILLMEEFDAKKHRQRLRQTVSYSEAEPAFPPFLLGNYLVEMYMKYKGGTAEQLAYLKGELQIDDFLEQKISTYSSGMKKKLALLLACIGTSPIILMDEPFNTLDADAQQGLARIVKQYHTEGRHFILASHQALPVADLPIQDYWKIDNQGLELTNKTEATHWLAELAQM